MEALLLQYGYGILFLGVMAEGEAFLLGASFLARRGYLSLGIVIAVAVAANSLADLGYYFLARTRGRAWLERRFGGHPRYTRLMEAMRRHARPLLLASRFVFGLRIAIPAACGVVPVPLRQFVPLNLLASALWAVPTALAGFYGGGVLERTIEDLHRYETWIAAALLALGGSVAAARRLRRRGRLFELRVADLHALLPFVIGLMGVLNLLSALLPRSPASIAAVESWLPLEVMQRSRPPMLFAGIALLQISRNLARRKALAWWVATGALSVSLLAHLGRGLDLHHSLVALLLLGYLMAFRHRFHARTDPLSLRLALAMVPVLAGAVLLYGSIGLQRMRFEFEWIGDPDPVAQSFRAGILTFDPALAPRTEHAARFLGSLEIAGWLARLYVLVLVLRPVILRSRQQAPPDAVARVLRAHGRHLLAAYAVQQDKQQLLVAEGRGLVGYAVHGAVAIACGDPLASDADFERALRDYRDHASSNGWTPCVYEAAEERLPAYAALGLRSLKIAEEAVVDLAGWSLAGGKRATLRAMVHKVKKAGLLVRSYDRAREEDGSIDEQLEAISEEWLAEKRLGELGFTLSPFSLDALAGVPVFVCLSKERVVAFCSFLPYRGGAAAGLDLMRKRGDAASGTMDLLISESLSMLKESGFTEASLANAPLANLGEPRGPLDKGVALLFEKMNSFYGYKNLFQFKKKFAPRWEGRHLVYPRGTDLPRVAYALSDLHGAGGLRKLLFGR